VRIDGVENTSLLSRLTQIEESEQLIDRHHVGIPDFAGVHDKHATSKVVFVDENVHDISLGESCLLVLGQQTLQQRSIFLSELGDLSQLEEVEEGKGQCIELTSSCSATILSKPDCVE
jgi:hypothetical protein